MHPLPSAIPLALLVLLPAGLLLAVPVEAQSGAEAPVFEVGVTGPADGQSLGTNESLVVTGWTRYRGDPQPGDSHWPHHNVTLTLTGGRLERPFTLITHAQLEQRDRSQAPGPIVTHQNGTWTYDPGPVDENGTWNATLEWWSPLEDGTYQVAVSAESRGLHADAPPRSVHFARGQWLELDAVETAPGGDGQPRIIVVRGRAGFEPRSLAIGVITEDGSPFSPFGGYGGRETTPTDAQGTNGTLEGTRALTLGPTRGYGAAVNLTVTKDEGVYRFEARTVEFASFEGATSAYSRDRPPASNATASMQPVRDGTMRPVAEWSQAQPTAEPWPPLTMLRVSVVAAPDQGLFLAPREWPDPVGVQTAPFRVSTIPKCDPDPCPQPAWTVQYPDVAVPAMGAAATAVLATVGFASTEAGRYAMGLFSRIRGPAVLEHGRREALYATIQASPGVRFSELRRFSGLGNGVLAHHLAALEREGIVLRHQRGLHVHFSAAGQGLSAAATLTLAGRTLLGMAGDGGWHPQAELARRLGLSRQAVHDQVHRLHQAGLVDIDAGGRVRRRPH